MTKIKIHPLFWLVFAAGLLTGHFYEVLLLFFIVFVHEMGHGTAAYLFKWRIEKIELLPFGGVAETDEHGNRPLFEECIVILAGPFQHVLLWGFAYLFYQLSLFDPGDYHMFVMHNTTILVFNLLPVWPLDGGRLLRVLCASSYPYKQAISKSLTFSSVLLAALCLWSLYYYPTHLNLWCVLSFLAVSHFHEWKQRHYLYMRFLMGRYYGKPVPSLRLKPIVVGAEEKLSDVLAQFRRGVYHQIIVRKNTNERIYDEADLLHAFFVEKKVVFPVGEL